MEKRVQDYGKEILNVVRSNVSPAVASGPLITTVNDLVAVISYYGLSWIFLIEVLHL